MTRSIPFMPASRHAWARNFTSRYGGAEAHGGRRARAADGAGGSGTARGGGDGEATRRERAAQARRQAAGGRTQAGALAGRRHSQRHCQARPGAGALMTEAGRVELTLLGQSLTVRTGAAPEHIRALAAYLEERVAALRKSGVRDPLAALTLAALDI